MDEAKEEIVKQIVKGVETFDYKKRTTLITDWAKSGIGFMVSQKHCQCPDENVFCCPEGWKVVSLGSRFCTKAEEKYSPVEGELMAVVYALEKARLWTLGNPNLTIEVYCKWTNN